MKGNGTPMGIISQLGWECVRRAFAVQEQRNKARRRSRHQTSEVRRLGAHVEYLECRAMLSVTLDDSTPTDIPIGNVTAGQTVNVSVDFTTSDPNDQAEGEPLILQPSAGSQIVISNYGTQNVSIPITQFGETLSAYIQDADGDESATIQLPRTVTVENTFTNDSKSLTVQYNVQGNANGSDFSIEVYRSTVSAFESTNPNQISVAKLEVSGDDAKTGEHTIEIGASPQYQFSQNLALRPDPANQSLNDPGHENVIVTADDNGALDSNDKTDPSQKSFHIYLEAAVAHGQYLSSSTDYVNAFASDLMANGYDYAFGFHWELLSFDPWSGAAAAGGRLAGEASNAAATHFQLNPNDVVDLNLIGHSRGAVVINQAMLALKQGGYLPQLEHGFMMETLVDPHPANNSISGFSAHTANNAALSTLLLLPPSDGPGLAELATIAKTQAAVNTYKLGQAALGDPGIVIPSNVQAAADYYQNTSASTFATSNKESTLNLWGLTPSP